MRLSRSCTIITKAKNKIIFFLLFLIRYILMTMIKVKVHYLSKAQIDKSIYFVLLSSKDFLLFDNLFVLDFTHKRNMKKKQTIKRFHKLFYTTHI
jgi:hypothetical protein